MSAAAAEREGGAIERYYRFHARIYDATRWSFLFGRTAILRRIAAITTPARILEVGCGTGMNLVNLCRLFPNAAITGVDLSAPMLAVARRKSAFFGSRVELLHRAYDAPLGPPAAFDLVLFSYALSMFNPGYDLAIEAAHADLAPGGHLAVVDFHDTALAVFGRWMAVNHVRMEGHLRPKLHSLFAAESDDLRRAYGGLWRYMIFVGKKARRD